MKPQALTIRTDPGSMDAKIDTADAAGIPAKLLSQSIRHYPQRDDQPSVVSVLLLVPPSHRSALGEPTR